MITGTINIILGCLLIRLGIKRKLKLATSVVYFTMGLGLIGLGIFKIVYSW